MPAQLVSPHLLRFRRSSERLLDHRIATPFCFLLAIRLISALAHNSIIPLGKGTVHASEQTRSFR
jgi:hypothetical protein